MSWSSLPDELVHAILAKICLIELARITTTCSSFRAAYCGRMAREQDARRQLAVNTFGAERIACMLALIEHLIKREPLPPGFMDEEWNPFWISADGVLHGPVSPTSRDASENGDIRVSLWREGFPASSVPWSGISVEARSGRGSMLEIQIVHHLRSVTIQVTPPNDEDLVPVALLQALLSEGLAQIIHDVGHCAKVLIGRPFMTTGFTQAGLKAQIMHLLPFAPRYTCVETPVGEPVWERMRIGQW